MRRLYGSLVAKIGYEVIYSPDAIQGRELARRFQPDLILMDFEMPLENGLKASFRLKEESMTSHIPIILLTNADLSMEAEKAMKETSINDYIQKGISNEEFIKRVKTIIEKKQISTDK
jgi:DNA-binding response OmpR family regulator